MKQFFKVKTSVQKLQRLIYKHNKEHAVYFKEEQDKV